MLTRREFVRWASATGALAAAGGCARTGAGRPKVVVIGAGYGGATAAKYVKTYVPEFDVAVVERDANFISCPISNLVLGGNAQLKDLTFSHEGLKKRGINLIRDAAVGVDAGRREVRLASGITLTYDRLILSPGVDFLYGELPGLDDPAARNRVLHAWKAGPQTLALREQLEAMPDGGVYVLTIPLAPYRCPPGPYERVCQVADYFRRAKPRSKIIVLDANPDIVSKAGLFRAAWSGLYPGMIDYRPDSELQDVDARTNTAILIGDEVRATVLNVVPPQKAGAIAGSAGAITANDRWCEIDWRTYESVKVPGVHILADATLSAPAMPKSATMANQHGHVCAAAVVALLRGQPVEPEPVILNVCYSFVDGRNVMHVASVHAYVAAEKTMMVVKGSSGVSDKASELEATHAWGWARNIWADALA